MCTHYGINSQRALQHDAVSRLHARTAAAVLARVQQATRPGAALSHARAHRARANALNVAAAHNKRCDGDVREVERQQFTACHVTTIIDARAQTVREKCGIL